MSSAVDDDALSRVLLGNLAALATLPRTRLVCRALIRITQGARLPLGAGWENTTEVHTPGPPPLGKHPAFLRYCPCLDRKRVSA